MLLNGRMSERSFRGYTRVRRLVGTWLRKFTLLTVQTEEYGDRLRALGADESKVVVTGSVKYDGLQHDRQNSATRDLRRIFGIADHERVLIAGSTQAPEEQIAIETYRELRSQFSDLRLVIVPRHRERFEEVAALIEQSGLGLLRRSTGTAIDSAARPVLLLDTLGELSACWGLADIAFVGGSLTNRGGQNMLEPAAYGAAVLFGPNTFNFRHAVALLLARDAARVVRSGYQLTETVRGLLSDDAVRRSMGERARHLVLSQQGATDRVVRLLDEILPLASATVRRAA